MKKNLSLWLPVFLWAGVIFYLSSVPSLKTDWGIWDFLFRKIAHVLEYFIFTALLYRAIRGSFILRPGLLIGWPCLLAFLYAVSDEYHQIFVFNRSGNVFDLMIDGLGICAFYVFYLKSKKDE